MIGKGVFIIIRRWIFEFYFCFYAWMSLTCSRCFSPWRSTRVFTLVEKNKYKRMHSSPLIPAHCHLIPSRAPSNGLPSLNGSLLGPSVGLFPQPDVKHTPNTGSSDSKSIHDRVLEHSLHQLLHEFLHRKLPLPHPSYTSQHAHPVRRVAGPQGLDRMQVRNFQGVNKCLDASYLSLREGKIIPKQGSIGCR